MKATRIVLVCFWVVMLVFTSFAQITRNEQIGQKPSSQTELTGVVSMEVVDETETSPLMHRYFVQQWDGENFRHIYLEGEVDFAELLHREVTFYGFGKDRLDFTNHRFNVTSFDQKFVVKKIGKIKDEPVINNVMAGPLTLPQPTHGSRNTLVQLITVGGSNSTHQMTQAEAMGITFTNQRSLRNWVRDASFRSYDIKGVNNPNGDVTSPMHLSASSENCTANMGNAWRIEADNMAEAQGFSKVQYQTRVHVYRYIPGCTQGYSATVGVFGSSSGVRYIFMHLPPDYETNPVQQELFFVSLIHELVHNLGQAAHDNGEEFAGGTVWEYGDRGGILGTVNRPIFPTNILRMKLGWMATSKCRIVEGHGSHFVQIQTPAIATKGIGPSSPPVCTITQLRDLNGNLTGEVLIPERRRQTGFWEQFPTNTQAYVSGVAMRRVNANLSSSLNGSVMVNPRPDIPCCFEQSVVMPGMSWTILANNYTLLAGTPTVYSQSVTITLGSNYPASFQDMTTEEFVIRGIDAEKVPE